MLFESFLCWWYGASAVEVFRAEEVAHIRLHYPVCVAGSHLPSVLQHTKRAFSLKEHSRVRLFKDDFASGKLNVKSL